MSRTFWTRAALFLGALVFLFPFYYMVVGSFQKSPDTTVKGVFPTGGWTFDNYVDINDRVDLAQSLLNSVIVTGGVLFGTVIFGVLAGYALARLHFRGRGTLFAVMLLVQIIPFQLLIIPIYVMIVRSYGLADSYAGMILPFAINSTAVFVAPVSSRPEKVITRPSPSRVVVGYQRPWAIFWMSMNRSVVGFGVNEASV